MSRSEQKVRKQSLQTAIISELVVGLSYTQIGARHNLSRQRVQQIVSPSPETRKAVLTHYKGVCQGCQRPIGLKGVGYDGFVHHLTWVGRAPENIDDPDNLQPLCRSCHSGLHQKAYWDNGAHLVELSCAWCGQPYVRYLSRLSAGVKSHYCSSSCQGKGKSASGRVEVVCPTCGVRFTRKRSHAGRSTNHYCSRACWCTRWKNAGLTIEVSCASCGKRVVRYRSQIKRNRQHFCSNSCLGKGRSVNAREQRDAQAWYNEIGE